MKDHFSLLNGYFYFDLISQYIHLIVYVLDRSLEKLLRNVNWRELYKTKDQNKSSRGD